MTDLKEFERACLLTALKYSELDIGHIRHGHPELPARDWTWEEWSLHLESLSRLLRVEGGRPDMDRLAVIAANVTALMIAVERSENADVTFGPDREAA